MELDQNLRPYATDRQWEMLEAWEKHGSQSKAAQAAKCGHKDIRRALKAVTAKAAKAGYAPQHGLSNPYPDGFKMGKTTIQRGSGGQIERTWERMCEDRERQMELVRESVQAMCEALPKLKPRPKAKGGAEDLMAVLPWGDPHFGLQVWGEECGDDFDLSIARRDTCAAVDYLVKQTPRCSRCLIINLGDYFHADNMDGTTARSGHILDMDTRLPKMVRVGVSAMRQSIESALDYHDTVEVINAVGNHDEVLAFALSIMLDNIYEDEPRVTIHSQPTHRHYVQFGKVLIGVTHGNKTKDRDLPGIMATEKPQEWGQTEFRYFYRGHHHHDARDEFNGCVVEQFRTLAAGDAYAVGHGFLSKRDMKALVMHKDFGEVERYVCGVERLRSMQRGD